MNFNISILLVAASVTFFGCKNVQNGKQSDKNGGTFTMAENTPIGTLYPISLTNQVEGLIVSQIHESLVRLNPKTLEVVPGLAEKWETSSDGKK